jgi:hypothetical protein
VAASDAVKLTEAREVIEKLEARLRAAEAAEARTVAGTRSPGLLDGIVAKLGAGVADGNPSASESVENFDAQHLESHRAPNASDTVSSQIISSNKSSNMDSLCEHASYMAAVKEAARVVIAQESGPDIEAAKADQADKYKIMERANIERAMEESKACKVDAEARFCAAVEYAARVKEVRDVEERIEAINARRARELAEATEQMRIAKAKIPVGPPTW